MKYTMLVAITVHAKDNLTAGRALEGRMRSGGQGGWELKAFRSETTDGDRPAKELIPVLKKGDDDGAA